MTIIRFAPSPSCSKGLPLPHPFVWFVFIFCATSYVCGQRLFVATLEAYDDFGFYIAVRQIVRQWAIKPIQLWLPFLGPSINFEDVGRDARRAFEEWSGELTVWLLPEIKKPARWMLDGIPNLAVPSEGFDRIDIVHVSEEGRVYAPSTSGRLCSNRGSLA